MITSIFSTAYKDAYKDATITNGILHYVYINGGGIYRNSYKFSGNRCLAGYYNDACVHDICISCYH